MTTMPQRRSDLTVTELGDESLIFDPISNVAHKLTAPAQAVWRECDGTSSVTDVASRLGLPVNDVQAACDELIDAKLATANSFSRRRLLQGGAVAGALFVSTVIIPKAAAAVSGPGGGTGGGQPANPQFSSSSRFDFEAVFTDFCVVTVNITNLPPGTYFAAVIYTNGSISRQTIPFTSTGLQDVWTFGNGGVPSGSGFTVQVYDAANQPFGPPSQAFTPSC